MADYIPSTPNSFLAVRAELDKIAVAIESQLDRDGTEPNYMEADFDMNGFQILNFKIDEGGDTLVASVFGRTGIVTAEAGDYSEFYLQDINSESIGSLIDVDTSGIQVGQILSWDGLRLTPTDTAAATTFVGLTDTPTEYLGKQGFILKVNTLEDGLEFANNIDDLVNIVDGGSF